MVVLGQGGCIWAKVVVFVQKLLYSGKSGCIREKWFQSGKKRLHPDEVVVLK